MTTQRVLPAKVYDALQMSAAMYGGIGGGELFADDYDIAACNAEECAKHVPKCYIGHLAHQGIAEAINPALGLNGCPDIFNKIFGIAAYDNDAAVREIRDRNMTVRDRVSFEDWCAELNVVRGPDDATLPQRAVAVASPELALSGRTAEER